MLNFEIPTKLPKMGGGGVIVKLLDENGQEVYNSGFVQNDLTDEGIWHVLSNFGTSSFSNQYPDSHRRNILFLNYIGSGSTYRQNAYIRIHDIGGSFKSSPLLGVGDVMAPINHDGKRYVGAKWGVLYPFGSVIGTFDKISFLNWTEIILTNEVEINDRNQLSIEYFRVCEVSDYFEDTGAFRTDIHHGEFEYGGNTVNVYWKPLNMTTEYRYTMYFDTSSSEAVNTMYFMLGGELVKTIESSRGSGISPITTNYNKEELTRSIKTNTTITPGHGNITFDSIVIYPRTTRPLRRPRVDLTFEFSEPITETEKDLLDFSYTITVKGSKDALDLTEIIPLLGD